MGSKKTVGWRTAMIVHELEHEIRIQERRAHLASEVGDLVARAQDLSRDRDQLVLLLRTLKSLLVRPAEAQVVPEWAHGYTAREIRDVLALDDEERAMRVAAERYVTPAGVNMELENAVGRVVRAFDPCIACAVHLTDENGEEMLQVKVK